MVWRQGGLFSCEPGVLTGWLGPEVGASTVRPSCTVHRHTR